MVSPGIGSPLSRVGRVVVGQHFHPSLRSVLCPLQDLTRSESSPL